jgi:predicted deacylase
MNIQNFSLQSLTRNFKHILTLDLTTLPDGNLLSLYALVAVGRETGPTVVVLAGVHGDEYEGITTIPEVFRQLDPALMRGTFIGVPVCNVPAYLAAARSSPLDGLNLARVFPGDPNGALTQRIAYWLGERIIAHADLLIDLHSAGTFYHLPPLCGYYRNDSEAGRTSREIALNFGVPVVWGHDEVAAGRTVSFATDHNIPWVYTETHGAGRVRPEDFAAYVRGVMNSLKVMGVLEGQPALSPIQHRLRGSGDLDKSIPANQSGLWFSHVNVLDDVREGDVLGDVRDVAGRVLEVVRAPSAGVVISLRGLPRVYAGDGLVALTGRE